MRSSRGTKSGEPSFVTLATKSTIAVFAGRSFQEGSERIADSPFPNVDNKPTMWTADTAAINDVRIRMNGLLTLHIGDTIEDMRHRHLDHNEWTLAAVDDVIARGRMDDWKQLRDIAGESEDVRARILRVCAARLSDPYAQRYHFWDCYVRKQLA
jgi:hypothetical protein